VDTFNGNYGLMRGLAAAFVMIFALAIVTSQGIIALCVLAVLFLLGVYRMHRFGRHYATELFTQFLASRAKEEDLPRNLRG
jgi:predicted RND superfamily exporter protein